MTKLKSDLDLKTMADFRKLIKWNEDVVANADKVITAYKLVDHKNQNFIHRSKRKVTYVVGKKVVNRKADTFINHSCAAGINVATLAWCRRLHGANYNYSWHNRILKPKIISVQFRLKDIAAIPINSGGKFRLFRCIVTAVAHTYKKR